MKQIKLLLRIYKSISIIHVYQIEIDAWEDSIHFVKIEIEGDINAFEIELIEKIKTIGRK